jgi:S-formylglutathione hydrolase FrmB
MNSAFRRRGAARRAPFASCSTTRLGSFGVRQLAAAFSSPKLASAPHTPDREGSTTFSFGYLSISAAALVLLGVLFFTPSALAQGRAECRTLPSKVLGHAVPYCAILPPSYDSQPPQRYPVLYSLHGLGGNSQTLIDSGGLDVIEDLWSRKQISEFLIVTPDAGRSFYVNSRDGKVRYEDFFIREFIPYIESHYRIRADRQHRGISGMSMGGYGALRFAFLYPNRFGSVSAHSAALVEKSPAGDLTGSQAFGVTRILGSAFGVPFDSTYWHKESPFTIVRETPNLAMLQKGGLKIYFDCGTDDSYGFNRGAQAFHDLLAARKIPHEFHLYPGSHDWTYFATHLPASLEFHSRTFSAK